MIKDLSYLKLIKVGNNIEDNIFIAEQKILNTDGLLDKIPEEYLSHKEKYENAVRKNVLFLKAMKKLQDPNISGLDNARYKLKSELFNLAH